MKFKAGDKVKFLNDTGGGVIRAVLDSKMVSIETDDGFEMPVLASELIPDMRAGEQHLPAASNGAVTASPAGESAKEQEEDRVTLINPWGKIREEEGIYLGYEPHETQWVLTGLMDIYLINHTSNDLVFNLFLQQEGKIRGVDFSFVPARSKMLLGTIDRDEIENWTRGYLQIMFHHDAPDAVYFPVHTVIDIKASRFFSEGSYRDSGMLHGRAIIVSIAPAITFEVASLEKRERKKERENKAQPSQLTREKALIDKHRTAFGEAVVDLHIGELVDNISGLSSHDMFTIQLSYFKNALESALQNDYRKVTFIHGVGNGVLKNALVEELKAYESTENKMAAISKFGVGALDVLIRNKE